MWMVSSEAPVALTINEDNIAHVLDAIYDAAVLPDRWTGVLHQLSRLFNSHFADVFARTDDWSDYRGLAVGLDQADYEDEFLDGWCKRNVWGKAKPVRVAGEVLPTWKMVAKRDVLRSDIYNEYLKPRDLNEGLRLALWSGEGWIQDISLLRPWSAGRFDAAEINLGKMLLPHLQRAAMASRRLAGMKDACKLEGLTQPAFLVDQGGRVIQHNASAEELLGSATTLAITGHRLTAALKSDDDQLAAAIAGAARINGAGPEGATVDLGATLSLTLMPLRSGMEWDLPMPRAALVLVAGTAGTHQRSTEELAKRFNLTRAESDLTVDLMSGLTLADIAEKGARSIHTVRSHLARVMAKTDTRRQAELVRLLMSFDHA